MKDSLAMSQEAGLRPLSCWAFSTIYLLEPSIQPLLLALCPQLRSPVASVLLPEPRPSSPNPHFPASILVPSSQEPFFLLLLGAFLHL